jgi:hypothetical protein
MNRFKLLLTLLLAQIVLFSSANAQKQFKTLLVTTTKGWHHESLHAGVLAIQQLGVKTFLMLLFGKTRLGLPINIWSSSRR